MLIRVYLHSWGCSLCLHPTAPHHAQGITSSPESQNWHLGKCSAVKTDWQDSFAMWKKKKKSFDFLLFKRLCKWEQLNRVAGTFSRYVLLLCPLSAVGWNEASGAMLSFSLTAMCVPLWQEGSGNWQWGLLVQSCQCWGWGLAAAGSYTATGCEIWVGLTVSRRGLIPALFECSALGSALPLRWEHLEVPADIRGMIWM